MRYRRMFVHVVLVLAAVLVMGSLNAGASYHGGSSGSDGHDHGAAGASGFDDLIEQVHTAISHATFSLGADESGPRQNHAHHVVNIIEGEDGPNFDGSKGNPGDGHGAITYAEEAAAAASGDAATWANNVVTYLQWASEHALAATLASDYDVAGESIHQSLAFLSASLGRADDDGALGAALLLAAATEESVAVDIEGFDFGDGEELTVSVGTTVVWTNKDGAPHTVTGGPLDSGGMDKGDVYSYTFDEAGAYEYVCAYHPSMTHVIVVE